MILTIGKFWKLQERFGDSLQKLDVEKVGDVCAAVAIYLGCTERYVLDCLTVADVTLAFQDLCNDLQELARAAP